jgi:3-deoxy-D-manno-octulosonate 8-phosphate phosphatase KdsC-like HAD superfamily phosphatase
MEKSSADIKARAADIRLLVLDVDGVLTDGRLYFSAQGEEFKCFHVRGGAGIVHHLRPQFASRGATRVRTRNNVCAARCVG